MSKYKNELLGENFSTATAKLKKSILFDLIKKLELDNCYRCTLKIDNIDDLSVEHKNSWQSADDPVNSFYDLDNIGFSHIRCNICAAAKPNKKYSNNSEYKKAVWKRYYAKNKSEILSKKRDRYHKKISE